MIIGNSRRYDRLRPMCGRRGKGTMKRSYRNLGQMYGDWSDQLALNGIHDCLQAVVRAELLVDMVKVIAEGLRTNT